MANEEEGTEVSTNLALASLPFHVVADLHAGRTPTPVKFKAVSAFNAGIYFNFQCLCWVFLMLFDLYL